MRSSSVVIARVRYCAAISRSCGGRTRRVSRNAGSAARTNATRRQEHDECKPHEVLLAGVLDAEHVRFRQRRLWREWRFRGKWRLRRERRFGLRAVGTPVRADDNRASPEAPAFTLGTARDSRVAFHRLAHRVDRPGVLLDFLDRIVITHASRRLAMIGRSAYFPEPSP